MKSNLVAWQPYWRARRALEIIRAKAGRGIPCDGSDWLEIEDALADLGQLAITIEDLQAREQHAGR